MKKIEAKSSKLKVLIFILVLLFIFLGVMVGIIVYNGIDNNSDNTSNIDKDGDGDVIYNTNEEVIGDKEINEVSFTNIECSFDGNQSLFKYTITNHGDKSIILDDYELVVKDQNKEVIAILVPGIDNEIKPGESYDTGNVIDMDLSNATSIELQLSE